MSRINVLVAAISADMKAEGIAAAVAQRSDMTLIADRVVTADEIGGFLNAISPPAHCGLVLVGPRTDTAQPAAYWVESRTDLVVLRVDLFEDLIRITARGVGLDPLLTALCELIDRAGSSPRERISQFDLTALVANSNFEVPIVPLNDQPLFDAAIGWIYAVLRSAIAKQAAGHGDFPGLAVTAATVADSLDSAHAPHDADADVQAADATLSRALAAADGSEPLAIVERALGLSDLEFRLLVLALAPELDPRYQRCIGLLMDDLGRRVGTLGLYSALLGDATQVRRQTAATGKLARWRVFEGAAGTLPHADDPLRLDPPLAAWLLGARNALGHDARIRRVTRLVEWPGAILLDRPEQTERATGLIRRLLQGGEPQWIVLANDNTANWRALLERAAHALRIAPIRVEVARLVGTDIGETEEAGIRLARMARLSRQPLVIDVTASEENKEQDEHLHAFLAATGTAGKPAALISTSAARAVRLLGSASYEIADATPLADARLAAIRAAASGADAPLTEDAAQVVASKYPLQVDRLEHAMRLARTRPLADSDETRSDRFLTACKDVSAEGASRLAERIEPVFRLDDVVLPADRKRQLQEIVDNIRLAPKVLDDWKFRVQLPYGRGVTALFHGPSGTGKTMAALGVAHSLGIQIMRVDLSRVVSKYIGDTEKNIDRVFVDAQMSGAALLIDEADALLGKRSEVNDAHDRYANIEVAFLLQRMEAYEGLAILTTNLRQNVDAAFLRRLRFIIDFPRPDIEAREKIWRQCLPEDSHELDEAAFRQFARKIDLTGGHVRQITLRAAFVAAAADSKIRIEHIAHATRAELAKLGLPPVEFDVAQKRRAA